MELNPQFLLFLFTRFLDLAIKASSFLASVNDFWVKFFCHVVFLVVSRCFKFHPGTFRWSIECRMRESLGLTNLTYKVGMEDFLRAQD